MLYNQYKDKIHVQWNLDYADPFFTTNLQVSDRKIRLLFLQFQRDLVKGGIFTPQKDSKSSLVSHFKPAKQLSAIVQRLPHLLAIDCHALYACAQGFLELERVRIIEDPDN